MRHLQLTTGPATRTYSARVPVRESAGESSLRFVVALHWVLLCHTIALGGLRSAARCAKIEPF